MRTALVTGSNRGIGQAVSAALAALDIRVLAAARRQEDADRAAAEIAGSAQGVALDLACPEDTETRAHELESTYGPIDILVNNAARLDAGNGLETPLSALTESLQVNAVAPYSLIRAVGLNMQTRGWGRIVNVSSGLGSFHEGLSGPAAYSISKATLNAITVSFARILGPRVKVNAVCPGWVRTRMGGPSAPRSIEEGADTPVWLATLPDDGPTGGFFRDRERIEW